MTLFYNQEVKEARTYFSDLGESGRYKMMEALEFERKCEEHIQLGTVPIPEELCLRPNPLKELQDRDSKNAMKVKAEAARS